MCGKFGEIYTLDPCISLSYTSCLIALHACCLLPKPDVNSGGNQDNANQKSPSNCRWVEVMHYPSTSRALGGCAVRYMPRGMAACAVQWPSLCKVIATLTVCMFRGELWPMKIAAASAVSATHQDCSQCCIGLMTALSSHVTAHQCDDTGSCSLQLKIGSRLETIWSVVLHNL